MKLVQGSVSSPCINSFRSKEGTREGVEIVTQAHTDTHKHKSHTSTHLFVDLIEYRIKTTFFKKRCLRDGTFYITKREATQKERKS